MRVWTCIAGAVVGLAACDQQVDQRAAGGADFERLLETVNQSDGQSWITFHPQEDLVLFGRHDSGFGAHQIYQTVWNGEAWSAPERAPFSSSAEERGARFAPDGGFVVYASRRARPDGSDGDWDLWRIEYRGGGRWGAPEFLPEPVNSDARDFHPSTTLSGELYFGSARGGGASDMFVARYFGEVWNVSPVDALNTEYSEPDPYVSSDGRLMVFAITDGPEGFGGDDLYISYREGEGWSAPRNLGERVNTAEYEYGAQIAPDGETLFYTTWADGTAKIAAVALSEIGIE